ncbi:MAG: TetR family transcriptional regulator [Microbacteriaceae bacterium]|nr:TetR family transcriptional regulator [Microbacteriaceae bacterium]
MTGPEPIGRRERKKAATRKAISDIATRMFIERGYDEVSIREIADAADVSPTTVFAHFPQKEALVFDEADDQRERIVAAVRGRAEGVTVTRALHDYLRGEYDDTVRLAGEHADEVIRTFFDLVRRTPALADYEARMWARYEDALAEAIGEAFGQAEPSDEVRAYARFVLQIWQLVNGSPNGPAMLDAAFRILDRGWTSYEEERPERGDR